MGKHVRVGRSSVRMGWGRRCRCEVCEHEYIRDFEVTTVGFKCTGRKCVQPNCSGRLRDQVLDWEDALPPKELAAAERCGPRHRLMLHWLHTAVVRVQP